MDYYQEGELIWLEADVTIRKLSGGKKSLNDFCAKFHGVNGNTPPGVVPYRFDNVISTLNSVQPYNWASFLKQRLASNSPHAPLSGITAGGYRLEYDDTPNEFSRAAESRSRRLNAWYSIGLGTGSENTVTDVLIDSPAYKAGIGPGMKIVAVNGPGATTELIRAAIRDTKDSSQCIEFILENNRLLQSS